MCSGVWTVGRPAGLVAATLVALSPFLIYYTTEARAYGLTLLLVLLSTLTLLRAIDTGRVVWWVAYALSSSAAIYAHYTPVYVLGAQALWAFFAHPRARLPVILANAGAAVAYLPWLPTLLDNTDSPGSKVIGILTPFNAANVRIELGRWGLGHPYVPLRDLPGWAGIAMFLGGVAAGATGLFLALRRSAEIRRVPRPSSRVVLVMVIALATPVGLLASSLIGDSVWNARNLTSSWPGLAVAVGALVTAPVGLVRVAAVSLVVGAFAIGAFNMLDADNQRPSYAEAADFIERTSSPGDVIVESPVPTPGPLAPLTDVADDDARSRHPVERLGYPSLRAKLRSPPYALLPVASAETVAQRALRRGRGGDIFVVIGGSAELRTGLLEAFQEGLPTDVRLDQRRTFPGLIPVGVYVFRNGAR